MLINLLVFLLLIFICLIYGALANEPKKIFFALQEHQLKLDSPHAEGYAATLIGGAMAAALGHVP